MTFEQQLASYVPFNEQETHDREVALRCLKQPDIYLRTNELVHITSSAWIVKHEFVMSILEDREPAIGVELGANITAAGLCAHESAMNNGNAVILPKVK